MTRFGSDYDEPFPNAGELWHANLMRALRGKRGMQVLRDLEAALLALPQPRLIESHVAKDGEVCLVGAYVLHKRVQDRESRDAVMGELERVGAVCECWHGPEDHEDETGRCRSCDARQEMFGKTSPWPYECLCFRRSEDDGGDDLETMHLGESVGLAGTLAWHLGYLNDERWGGLTPEERWENALAWTRLQLAA